MKIEDFVTKLSSGKDVTIVTVGDSVTHGLNHCRNEETYTAKIAMLFAEKFPHASVYRYDGVARAESKPIEQYDGPILVHCGDGSQKITVIKSGVGGDTVVRAANRIDDFTYRLPGGAKADLMTMMFGINDALLSDKSKYVTADVFKTGYMKLVSEVHKRCPDTVIAIITATCNDQTIEEHCKVAAEMAQENGLTLVDLHRLFNEHYDKNAEHFGQGDWLSNVTYDACHPSPKGAEVIAGYIFANIVK